KGIISLKNDRGTSYDMYIQVQNELAAAVSELRDELSVRQFGVPFKDLVNEDRKKAIQQAIPISISEAEPENVGGN
ncbi:MAG: biopolymer transporter ExbD, partial [Bacteroidales bacterium]|nr:biopolymer transporter ExbD [Bacteroidales bacterium]